MGANNLFTGRYRTGYCLSGFSYRAVESEIFATESITFYDYHSLPVRRS